MTNEYIKKSDGFTNEQLIVVPTESFKSYAQHPLVREMFLTDVGYFPSAKHHYRDRKEGIEEYILIYCTEGQGIIKAKEEIYKINKNQVFCIPRNTQHQYYSSEENPWSILWVHFGGEKTKYFPLNSCKIIELTSSHATSRLIFLFNIIFRVLNQNYTLGNFIYLSQVLSLMLSEIYFREKGDETSIQNKHLTFIIRYMYKNIDKNLTLIALSEASGLSISYLNQIFNEYTHRSPIDFFISIKMEEACKLLKLTDLLVYEVSQKLGYSDPYYFSRIFKKTVGMSPKTYQKGDSLKDLI